MNNINWKDPKPRQASSEWVIALKNQAGKEATTACTEHYAWQAAEYIIRLENRIIELESKLNDKPIQRH